MENNRIGLSGGAAAAAADELARLEALEDAVWFDPKRIQIPALWRVAIVLAGVAVVSACGVLFVRYPNGGLLVSPVIVALFIWAVTRIERRYSTALSRTLLPPRRVWRKFMPHALIIGLPTGIGMGVGLNVAVAFGAAWWVFAVLAAATIGTSLLLAVLAQSRGWLDVSA